jgi:hypothetical protein
MRSALVAVVAVVAGLAMSSAQAQAAKAEPDCSQWVEKKGYSTDYIKLRTGNRQRGMAEGWRGNIAPKDVQPGDVVVTHIPDKGRRMRVSYVEEVRPGGGDGGASAVIVTEWNEGKYIDEPCFVTDHFGRDSGKRSIPIDTVVRAWRPSLPLSGAAPE